MTVATDGLWHRLSKGLQQFLVIYVLRSWQCVKVFAPGDRVIWDWLNVHILRKLFIVAPPCAQYLSWSEIDLKRKSSAARGLAFAPGVVSEVSRLEQIFPFILEVSWGWGLLAWDAGVPNGSGRDCELDSCVPS